MSTVGSDFRSALLHQIPSLRAYARALCRGRDGADDIVQATLLAAWEKKETLRDLQRLRPWLLQILRNEHLMLIRSRNRDMANSGNAVVEAIVTTHTHDRAQNYQDVQAALTQLSPAEQEAIMLVAIQDMTYEQAAVICSCPTGTMKSRVSRARARLREIMGETSTSSADDVSALIGNGAPCDVAVTELRPQAAPSRS